MSKKQVILIMTDTTRKDMLGCYGNKDMVTPNIDRLSNEGVRFDRAYTTQPVCGPARSALFTGIMPHSNGMVANSMPLGANVTTIGKRLSDNGYKCGYVGKWHLDGGDYFGTGICPEGYDKKYWYDMKLYLDELSEEEKLKSRKASTAFDDEMDETFTYAHRCTNRGIDYIKENKDNDFFLTLSYDEPHGPSLCPKPFNTMYEGYKFPHYGSYDDTLENKPYYQKLWSQCHSGKTPEQLNSASKYLSLFLGCNSFVDYEIGRILEVIDTLDNPMIIFTSDHGDASGAHRLSAKGPTVYEEIAGVPLIIKSKEANKVSNMPVSHLDIVPTILDYMGVNIPNILEGKSILKHIENTENKVNNEVFCEFTRYEIDHDGFGGLQMMRAIIDDRYKLAVHLLDTDELYDNENDPYELNNLINDSRYEEVRNKLHDKLLNFMNETRDPFRGYQWAMRPWRSDKKASWDNDGYTRQRENEEYETRQLDYATGLPMVEAVRKK